MKQVYKGAYTAIVTPFNHDGRSVDYDGLRRLCEFQVRYGISGIVSVGTTGESPTLTWDEHIKAFETTQEVGGKITTIASTGSNSTSECIEATRHATKLGIRHVLLVDPYYNGPSSLEIRREYVEPVASTFPEVGVIPYIIPGRCATQLLPQDLALANRRHPNVRAVKEATGDFNNMKQIRKLCGQNFDILSGDDDKTLQMMLDPEIKAAGVISVISNIAPKAVQEMCQYALRNDIERLQRVGDSLKPLSEIVTVKTNEQTDQGTIPFKARNPLPIKTLMRVLGLPVGPLRPPMGKLTRQAIDVLLNHARKVQKEHPEIFEPLAEFFDIDVQERLTTERHWQGLHYDGY